MGIELFTLWLDGTRLAQLLSKHYLTSIMQIQS